MPRFWRRQSTRASRRALVGGAQAVEAVFVGPARQARIPVAEPGDDIVDGHGTVEIDREAALDLIEDLPGNLFALVERDFETAPAFFA